MSALPLFFLLFFAFTGHSSASYCLCNTALPVPTLQKNIDYACGNGANCGPILQNGPCYNPNTVQDHCNYAVNQYFQATSQAPTSCNFTGTAMVSQTPPAGASPTCFPSSPGGVTPATPTPPGTGPGTGTAPGTGPGTGTAPGTGTGTAPGTGTGTGTGPNPPSTTTPGISSPTTFSGLGPNTGVGIPNNSSPLHHQNLYSFTLLIFISGLIWLRLV